MYPYPTFCRSISILPSNLRLVLLSCLLPSNVPTKTLYTLLLSPHTCHMSLPNSFCLIWITRIIIGKEHGSYRYVACSTVYVKKIHVVLFPTFTQKTVLFGNYSASEDGDVPRNYRGADKFLARPGRKQANVSVRIAWISSGALPCRKKKTWWQLASRCCWNRTRPLHASEFISFLVGLRTYQHPCHIAYYHHSFKYSNLVACSGLNMTIPTSL